MRQDARFLAAYVDLIVYSVDSFKVWQQQAPASTALHYDSVFLGVEL